jgi:hypothetical protein
VTIPTGTLLEGAKGEELGESVATGELKVTFT